MDREGLIVRALSPLLALLALLACLSAPARAAMQGEPQEFLGIPFGKPSEPDRSFVCEQDSEEGVSCTRASDPLVLHGVPLKSLRYVFLLKHLYTVDAEVAGRERFDKLAQELTARHGQPEKQPGGMLAWSGKNVDILLHYDAHRQVGEVDYIYKLLPCPVE